MSGVAKIITENGITLYYKGGTYVAEKSHPNYEMLLSAVRLSQYDEFIELLNDCNKLVPIKKSLTKNFTLDGENLFYMGRQVGGVIAERIIELIKGGYGVNYMENFLANLFQNTSNRAIEEAYKFLENRNIPITEDGHFLGYRSVRHDYYSKKGEKNLILISGRYNEDGRIYNGIGEVIECERSCVNDDPNIDCGRGLHVGGLSYAGPGGTYFSNGDRVIIVKVNPKDIVTIPHADCEKIRVCRYEVIGEYIEPLPSTTTAEPIFIKDEEQEEEHPEAFQPNYLDIEDLEVGMNIKFKYNGEERYAQVRSFNLDVINMILLYKDPSFRAKEVNYRNFIDDKIYGIELY